MSLEYEWGNPVAAAAAMLLFGEEPAAHDTCHQERQGFEHYAGGGAHVLPADFFSHPAGPTSAVAGLFPPSTPASFHQRYNVALPAAPTTIGLDLGVRTYFSSSVASAELGMVVGGRTSRRRTRVAKCQAEGCGADLAHAKHYHRRHKVCEFHSKASTVITAGLSQRFCQQCSRFHVLSEFDHGKRSCRKRLADHNRRRRKSQDLTTILETSNPQSQISNNETSPNKDKVLFTATSSSSNNNQPMSTLQPDLIVWNKEPPLPSTPPPPPPPSQPSHMALGLGCFAQDGEVVVVPASTGLSASSSTGISPTRASFLSGIGEFREQEHRFCTPCWDEAEDGSSIRGLFQQ